MKVHWDTFGRIMRSDDVKTKFGIDLLPCPFCASTTVGLYLSGAPHVTCGGCEADGPAVVTRERNTDTEQAMYAACLKWNTRLKIE